MSKLIKWYDNIAKEWRNGYIIGYTSKGSTVIEDQEGGVVLLPEGTARICDIGVEND